MLETAVVVSLPVLQNPSYLTGCTPFYNLKANAPSIDSVSQIFSPPPVDEKGIYV